jgi:hypothetical protein
MEIGHGEWSMDQIQNSKFKIQNSKFKIQNSKFKIQNSKFKIDFFAMQRTRILPKTSMVN